MNQDRIWDHFQNEGVESFSQSGGRLEFLAQRVLPNTRILNIGVGNGSFERLVVSRAEVWSLDPSERAINNLRQALAMGEKAQVGYSQKLPFADGYFDMVVMSEVLEHLEPSVFAATLVEVARVLRPNGKFMGTVPARERLAEQAVVCPNCGHHFHRWGHAQSFDIDVLRAKLNATFDVESIYETFFIEWASVSFVERLKGLVKKFLSFRGVGTYGVYRNIFFVARRR